MIYAQVHLTLPAWVHQEVDIDSSYPDDETRMALVIRLARRNVELNTGGPFGAAIFNQEGRIVSIGVNRVMSQNCSLAHAEIMAFMTAQSRMQRFRLNEDGARFTLATSAQPCCQCYGASFWAGIDEMLIGARSEDVMELTEFDEGPLPADWIGELVKRGIAVKRDVMRQTAREVLAFYRDNGGASY
jgi:tRNA(Arg) A34 adenosine deaminase TadA